MKSVNPADHFGILVDPGRAWHPDASKFNNDGTLPDLDDDELAEHLAKPEALIAEGVLAAEDSKFSPPEEI